MEKFIPRQKLSKKAKRALDNAQRATWGAFNPVTRKTKNPKAYDRKKPPLDHDLDGGIFYYRNVTTNLVYFPTSLSARISPPCAATIACAMARPRPYPPLSRARPLSTR